MGRLPRLLTVTAALLALAAGGCEARDRGQAIEALTEELKRDPSRQGKAGIWRALQVRGEAMQIALNTRAQSSVAHRAPFCQTSGSLLLDQAEEVHVAMSWQSESAILRYSSVLTWWRAEAPPTRTHIRWHEIYSDGLAALPGERVRELVGQQERRYARTTAEGPFAVDPYPSRRLERLLESERLALEALAQGVERWSAQGEGGEEEVIFKYDAERGASLGCGEAERALSERDEVERLMARDELVMSGAKIERAVARREAREALSGWVVEVTWRTARGERIEASAFRARRLKDDEERALTPVGAFKPSVIEAEGVGR